MGPKKVLPLGVGPESNDNERILRIPQTPRQEPYISYSLISYPGHSLRGRSYPLAEMQSPYSTADWTKIV